MKKNDHTGSSFDTFLAEEGLLNDAEAVAIKRIVAWQLKQAMDTNRVTKKAMAERLNTSRAQIDRLLDPEYVGITLENVARAARALGKRIDIRLLSQPAKRKTRLRRRAA